jgi:hypothetical protein
MKIYLDTNVWNLLCDRDVDSRCLRETLASTNSALVLGTHTIYELAKTFVGSQTLAKERGNRLFLYLKNYVDAKIDCVKGNTELLAAEMWALKSRAPEVASRLNEQDLEKLQAEVAKLAVGNFDDRARDFVDKQSAFANTTRLEQVRFLNLRSDMKQQMKGIPVSRLEMWLNAESVSSQGVAMLAHHILRYFPEAPSSDAIEYSEPMLRTRFCRFAHGVVRADLYYNWRCANRGSNPRDLVDDMYHVLNSTYCDLYVTCERGQSDYAALLLTPETKVAIYDCAEPIQQWLTRVCSSPSVSSAASTIT